MNRDRISNLTRTKDGQECVKVKYRRKWVTFLRKHLCPINVSNEEKREIINWANNVKVKKNHLQTLINDLSWRKSDMLNY
jgi:hypothetical protein